MLRGMYTAASGMSAQVTAQEILSNNLANANTTGYKKDITVNGAFQDMIISRVDDQNDKQGDVVIGKLGTGAYCAGSHTDLSMGSLSYTGNQLDVALSGDGFFVVQTPAGERYTRDGSFSVNARGELVTKDGYQVLGRRGTIVLDQAVDVSIGKDGGISAGGAVINELLIVSVENPIALQKTGNNLYTLNPGSAVNDRSPAQTYQGFLEASNVNVISEMVNMITGMRIYEANQRSILAQDSSLEQLITTIGRV